MPSLEDHCISSKTQYGVEGRDIHIWMDAPVKLFTGSHRMFRHDAKSVKLVGQLFFNVYGRELAENIALDHILRDRQEIVAKKPKTVNTSLRKVPTPLKTTTKRGKRMYQKYLMRQRRVEKTKIKPKKNKADLSRFF